MPVVVDLPGNRESIDDENFEDVFARKSRFVLQLTYTDPLVPLIIKLAEVPTLLVVQVGGLEEFPNESLENILVESLPQLSDLSKCKHVLVSMFLVLDCWLKLVDSVGFLCQFHEHFAETHFIWNNCFEHVIYFL